MSGFELCILIDSQLFWAKIEVVPKFKEGNLRAAIGWQQNGQLVHLRLIFIELFRKGNLTINIFFAFPFSSYVNGKISKLPNAIIKFLNDCQTILMDNGHNVFLAHYREKWGEQLMLPEECTPEDLKEMMNTDIVIAFPGNPISGGVHIELGWASALQKRIILFLEQGVDYSPLVIGLNTITNTEIVYYDDLFDNSQVKNKFFELIEKCNH